MSLLAEFLDGAPPGTAATLAALACAESLTNDVALSIYSKAPVPGLSAEDFVSAFKYSGLTEPRNSEWSLTPGLRQELVASNALSREVKKKIHRLLLSLGQDEANRKKAGSEVPSYLFTEAGIAYHYAGAGHLESALEHYSAASVGTLNGAQWLGAKLAEEQERTGAIPEGKIETTFLRAWVMFREGHKRDAMPLFRKIAATDLEKREVAISLHIVGNENNRGQRRGAERELRRSIEIGSQINNQFHVAQTLHSLANMLSRQKDRLKEAEEAYRESIEIDSKLNNQLGIAKTLHSLANMLSRQKDRLKEAEEAYKESLELGEEIRNDNHVAQVLRSYGLAVEIRSAEEAIVLLQRSLEINRRRGSRQFVRLVERDIREIQERAASS